MAWQPLQLKHNQAEKITHSQRQQSVAKLRVTNKISLHTKAHSSMYGIQNKSPYKEDTGEEEETRCVCMCMVQENRAYITLQTGVRTQDWDRNRSKCGRRAGEKEGGITPCSPLQYFLYVSPL